MMIGADYTDNKTRCIAIAASIHYFMLAGWLWMLAHGVSMYKSVHFSANYVNKKVLFFRAFCFLFFYCYLILKIKNIFLLK